MSQSSYAALRTAANRLNGLMEDQQPGLASWNGMVAECVSEIAKFAPSESAPITDNDLRWRLLEHGCQWVSWTETGGETHSFDPRHVPGLTAMRKLADDQRAKQMADLRNRADTFAASLNPAAAWPFPKGRRP